MGLGANHVEETDLSLEFLRVVEQAAIASARTMGRGDAHAADRAAVEAMRQQLDRVPIDGTIVIGEGERDDAPMLFIGERVGICAQRRQQRAIVPARGHRRGSARGDQPLRGPARRTQSRCWRLDLVAHSCMPRTSTWRN
jgi:hypothetical protein